MFPVSCVGAALVVCVRSDALRLTFSSHTVSFHSCLHGLRLESSLWLTLMCCSRGRKPFTSQTVSLNMHYISFQMFFSTSPYHLGYCCYTAKLPIIRHAHCDVLVSVLNNVDIKAEPRVWRRVSHTLDTLTPVTPVTPVTQQRRLGFYRPTDCTLALDLCVSHSDRI